MLSACISPFLGKHVPTRKQTSFHILGQTRAPDPPVGTEETVGEQAPMSALGPRRAATQTELGFSTQGEGQMLSNYQGLPRLRRRDCFGRGSTGSVSSSAPPPLRAPLPEAFLPWVTCRVGWDERVGVLAGGHSRASAPPPWGPGLPVGGACCPGAPTCWYP